LSLCVTLLLQRINNDAREDEMEENMQAVGGMLGNLKARFTNV
jgi:DNA anti-recombination protein RmuC